jgi:formamidopyrimidine-DNA glycosylase
MPELPEVENIVLGLKKLIKNCIIKSVIVEEEKIVAHPEEDYFCEKIKNKQIINVSRRGKYILIALSRRRTLVIHLRIPLRD